MRTDENIIRMAQSVTDAEVETIERETEYALIVQDINRDALIRAVKGMAGKRYAGETIADGKITFTIRYKDDKADRYHYDSATPHTQVGDKFCKEISWAIQFTGTPDNARRIAEFVGGGELEIPQEGKPRFHFLDQISGIFKTATEGDYILYTPQAFQVIPEQDFMAEWMPLNR